MVSLELEARLDNLHSTAQAETADIDLFAHNTEREECPICMIPFSSIVGATFFACCGKRICNGCVYKHVSIEVKKGVGREEYKCTFCQQTLISTHKNDIKCLRRLMKNNNPRAYTQMADRYESGKGVIQSYTRALELFIQGAELGSAKAYALIGSYYEVGTAVDHDMSKALDFFEIAAKKGSIDAHRCLAVFYERTEDKYKSVEHLKVVASAGDQESMDKLMKHYKNKELSKEELTQTLRAFQASSNEMKSKDRDDARDARE